MYLFSKKISIILVFVRDRNSCVSDLSVFISVASEFEIYHQMIVQFIDFNGKKVLCFLVLHWDRQMFHKIGGRVESSWY